MEKVYPRIWDVYMGCNTMIDSIKLSGFLYVGCMKDFTQK